MWYSRPSASRRSIVSSLCSGSLWLTADALSLRRLFDEEHAALRSDRAPDFVPKLLEAILGDV